jgi:hypothetical protein
MNKRTAKHIINTRLGRLAGLAIAITQLEHLANADGLACPTSQMDTSDGRYRQTDRWQTDEETEKLTDRQTEKQTYPHRAK